MKTAAAETPEAGRPCGPLKIGVIGANGKSGSLIAREAAGRGNDVTAIVRRDVETPAGRALVRDVFDLTAGDLAGFDAVVDAFGTSRPEGLPLYKCHLGHLASVLAGTATRLLVVGGAGSLYADGERTGSCILAGEEFTLNSGGERRHELRGLRDRPDR